jgi:hypothetical protein
LVAALALVQACTRPTHEIVIPATPAAAEGVPDALATQLRRHGYRAVPLVQHGFFAGAGLYTVEATLDGHPASLLFDSGFNQRVVLVPATAAMIGLRGTASGNVEGAAGTFQQDTGHVRRLVVGDLDCGSQRVSIGPFPEADGGLGAAFLHVHRAVADYPSQVLYVKESTSSTKDRGTLDALRRSDVVVPLQVLAKGERTVYLVRAIVKGHPATLLLDTGWGMAPLTLDTERAVAWGLDGPTLDSVMLESLRLTTVPFTTFDLSRVRQKMRETGFPPIDGIVGSPLLLSSDALIDFGQGALYLHPQKADTSIRTSNRP